jgi:hypothetical protein
VIHKPLDKTVSACSYTCQSALNSAFATWLAGFTKSGGCNPTACFGGTPTAPSLCTGGTTTVTYSYHDLCETGSVTSTFTVTPPAALVIHKPNDYSANSCAFTSQWAVNCAFANWLTGFTKSGGCNPSASYGCTPTAPSLCTGGTTTVTYNYSDICSNGSVTATFTIVRTNSITNPAAPGDSTNPTITSIETESETAAVHPIDIDLNIAPNPFAGQTNINYTLSKDTKVTVEIYNIMGAKVATLYEGEVLAGQLNTVKYESTEVTGNQVLLCVIRTPKGVAEKRMVVLR